MERTRAQLPRENSAPVIGRPRFAGMEFLGAGPCLDSDHEAAFLLITWADAEVRVRRSVSRHLNLARAEKGRR